MFLDYGNKITGSIEKEVFDNLTNELKENFLETVRIRGEVDGYIRFQILNKKDADEIYTKIRTYEKNKNRSESRKESLNILSSGINEKEDIEALYNAQEGLCYYTSQPLVKKPKNYAIDHVVPVTQGGSSWPSNLVLATTEINREKHSHSKRKIFAILEKRYGKEWVKKQREFCKKVDSKRRTIDRKRRAEINEMLGNIEASIRTCFPSVDIDYTLVGDDIELFVNYTVVNFPAGFIRQKKKSFSCEYISKLVEAIIFK